MPEKFSYKYSAPTEEERREIEDIQKQYLPEKTADASIKKLRMLNAKVHRVPMIAALTAGIAGTLILGAGMAMSLEWNLLAWGVVVGLTGIAVLALAYPLHKFLLNRSKKKYGEEILKLSDELLNINK